MRRTLIVLACLFLFVYSFAQTEIGFQAGITNSRFWGNEGYRKYHTGTAGFSFGGIFRKGISGHFSLMTGLSFERTGSRINDLYFEDALGNNFAKGDVVFQLDYLTVPITIHYNFGKHKALGLGAGVFGGYLVSAKNKFHYESDNTGLPEKTSSRNNCEDFNFGLTGSASYRLHIAKNKSVVFSVEDHWGVSNIGKLPNEKRKTNSVGFYASFLINPN